MDVTPRELRDTDIREGFRGYHRDDVDELLERAAATVEGLTERVRQLTERLSGTESSTAKSRETEEMLQRTLVLAQKTADEAIADAQQRSRALLEESEAKARNLVNDAESSARRIADTERQRLETEIVDLAGRRDALTADVDALEKYESEYRSRLRTAIESELDSLGKFSTGPGDRPPLRDVEVPPPREAVANSGRPSERQPERPSGRTPAQPTVELGAVDPFPASPAESSSAGSAPDSEHEWTGPDPTTREEVPAPQVGHTPELADFVPADEPLEPEVLDDDAFFATLREAVRDDAPLGPREGEADDALYDPEEPQAPRRRFRRRR